MVNVPGVEGVVEDGQGSQVILPQIFNFYKYFGKESRWVFNKYYLCVRAGRKPLLDGDILAILITIALQVSLAHLFRNFSNQ